MKPIRTTLTLATADADGVAQSQNPGSGADVTINGALASGGVATFDVARRVRITSGGNDTAVTFTLYGTDRNGIAIQESVTGTNTSTADSVKDYKTVTRIATSGDAAAGLTIGTGPVASTPWIPICSVVNPCNIALAVMLSAGTSMTYSVEHTLDEIQNLDLIKTGTITTLTHEDLVSKTASADGNYAFAPTAVRVTTSAYSSGTLTFTVIQAG